MKKDRYRKVSDKWWYDSETGKWIHDDRMTFILLGKPSSGTNLPRSFRSNKSGNRTH